MLGALSDTLLRDGLADTPSEKTGEHRDQVTATEEINLDQRQVDRHAVQNVHNPMSSYDFEPPQGSTDYQNYDKLGLGGRLESDLMMSDLLSHPIDLLDDDMLNAATENQSEIGILDTECVRAPTAESSASPLNLQPTAKIGTRFSRETNGILKAWFSQRADHPYPSKAEKRQLQQQTGLSSLQLTNWLANARRRSALPSSNPSPRSLAQLSYPNSGDTISRPSTPMVHPRRGPLGRWIDSPPENEAADAADIARALGSLSQDTHNLRSLRGDPEQYEFAQDSASNSANTTRSSRKSGSLADSRSSSCTRDWGRSPNRRHGRVRTSRRGRGRQREAIQRKRTLGATFGPYQCTFCTETFDTKHNWQRHETSIHLPLETWVCTPQGPRTTNTEAQQVFCSFCGINDPDEDHIETHNTTSCQERAFSRKDHLRQHLRLVHNATPVEWIISQWRTPQLQNPRELFNFTNSRIDLIGSESQTPFPFRASVAPPDSPRNAYELIHLELTHFIQKQDGIPESDVLQLEGCRTILVAEGLMRGDAHDEAEAGSWLRDIFFSNNDISQRARFSPLRSKAESCLAVPKLHGQRQLFDGCPLEAQLRNFMLDSVWSGQAIPSDAELRAEACRIVSELGSCFTVLLEDAVATWLMALIESAQGWLSAFRMRFQTEVNIRTPSDGQNAFFGGLCVTAHSLQDVMQPTSSITAEPIRHFSNGQDFCGRQQGSPTDNISVARDNILRRQSRTSTTAQSPQDHRPSWIKANLYFLNDANYHRWLGRELGRWVLSTTSLNNPNSHIPSDEELRHQARCILYDDDDPWNHTPADNAEWLRRFKCEFDISGTAAEDGN
ncbi:hypothetical protein LCI18_008474 [Fusarium solani-melongenae]|uniref:Uncharacterized protein n=1 Tax=Fusarium solani subsp. cucurbitae TaxID=2747967 RepID=A0ACD3Z8C1_FUSSC|nr:hypothetical protein LCI18_008474 [Fusarium solani-melongenae]